MSVRGDAGEWMRRSLWCDALIDEPNGKQSTNSIFRHYESNGADMGQRELKMCEYGKCIESAGQLAAVHSCGSVFG